MSGRENEELFRRMDTEANVAHLHDIVGLWCYREIDGLYKVCRERATDEQVQRLVHAALDSYSKWRPEHHKHAERQVLSECPSFANLLTSIVSQYRSNMAQAGVDTASVCPSVGEFLACVIQYMTVSDLVVTGEYLQGTSSAYIARYLLHRAAVRHALAALLNLTPTVAETRHIRGHGGGQRSSRSAASRSTGPPGGFPSGGFPSGGAPVRRIAVSASPADDISPSDSVSMAGSLS